MKTTDAGAAPDTVQESRVPTLWLLALITFSGTLAMHIFVPVLPIAGQSLHAGAAEMQSTISIYILGLAAGQLVYGPISDRYGRRPVLMAGLVVYTLASIAALFASDIHMLIAARLFQALGGGTGLVIGRAIVRDTSASAESTRRLAMMNLMVAIGPGLAPVFGSLLAGIAGWRAIFAFLCLLGACNMICAWRILPETSKMAKDQSFRLVARNYVLLLRTPAFLGFAIGGSCATTSMYAFIGAAPFLFVEQLHRPATEVGVYLGVIVLGYWFGNLIASRLVGRVPVRRLLSANLISLAAGLFLIWIASRSELTVIGVIAAMLVYTLGAGIASPAAMAEAIGVNPLVAGSASGLYGFFQMVIGALATAGTGLIADHALAAAIVVVTACIVSQACFRIAVRPVAGLVQPAAS
ncbi:MAG: multidrug effflux MFS transporter [Neorhizobium sp.]|nr:multidrug effflux MFS transporter [Neorhizobium sp.]